MFGVSLGETRVHFVKKQPLYRFNPQEYESVWKKRIECERKQGFALFAKDIIDSAELSPPRPVFRRRPELNGPVKKGQGRPFSNLLVKPKAIARQGKSFPSTKQGKNPRKMPLRKDLLFYTNSDYSYGSPNPIKEVNALTRIAPYGNSAYVATQAFANPLTGAICLGLSGGNDFYSHGGVFTMSAPLPERWILGDMISSSASIFQVIDAAGMFRGQQTIAISVGLNNAAVDEATSPFGLEGLYGLNAGLVTSALSGLVGLSGVVSINATVLSKGNVASMTTQSFMFMKQAINSSYGALGIIWGEGSNLLIDEWKFVDGSVDLGATVEVNATIDQIIVEVRVEIAGMRGGIDDPGAGLVAAAFNNLGMPYEAWLPSFPCPYYVSHIAVSGERPGPPAP
jgi:hypothetical protein